MFKSFQTRLVLFFVALFALVEAVTFLAVQNGIIKTIYAQAQDQLLTARGILERQISATTDDLAQGTSILATDFGFRQAVATADHSTIASALNNLATRIKADRIMLMSVDGIVTTDTGAAADAAARGDIVTLGKANAPFPFATMTETAERDGRSASIAVLDGRIYQLVVVPILAPVPIAWIAIGLEIGNTFAADMRRGSTVPVEVTFGFADEMGKWTLAASTLEEPLRGDLAAALSAHTPSGAPETIKMEGDDYVTVVAPIPGPQQGSKAYAILQYSLKLALAPYRTLFLQLIGIATVVILFILVSVSLVARTITKPIRRLDAAAQRIQIGQYTEKVPVQQSDEIGRLSQTFNQMMEGIAEREDKIAFQARHDMVTGLPNRVAFEVHIATLIAERAPMAQRRFSILLLQIGRFSEINNTLGHNIGDELMRKISRVLKDQVRIGTFVARHASNMFALSLATEEEAIEIAVIERILAIFGEPVDLDGVNVDVTGSIGVARYPDHGLIARTLLQHADSAMYVAKKKGITHAIYDADLDPHRPERLSMMGELRQGLEKGQFQLYFQPKVDIATGTITAAEALIRWAHPDHGFMAPDHFIPLAEQTGNIGRLTAWVLDSAVKQSRLWADKGIDVKIAVNLSARDLMNRHLPDTLGAHLADYGVRHDRLILEITESAIMEDPINALGVLNAFHTMGLTLSIDDYGTGYSSLAYLKSLPVHEIKIDKSFVTNLASNPGDEILVRSTIELGHNLGLRVTAEGIEDAAALAILDRYGCETGQGYYISKPLAVAEFETFFASSQWSPKRNAVGDWIRPSTAAAGG
ncbi:MAG: EAL domain-containing protein [Rhodospirillaceae bacterium]|nr:MAG: EAL domain-containing protein [Rhodospirillaceae bacterium]